MVKEELIKTARRCADAKNIADCEGCPYVGEEDCVETLLTDLADEAEKMTANEYQALAMRTAGNHLNDTDKLMNGLMGLCGESGECIDLFKKCYFQGHKLDADKLAEELGDVAWYLALSADAIHWNLSEVMTENIEKLKKRYPEGFSAERSMNRED